MESEKSLEVMSLKIKYRRIASQQISLLDVIVSLIAIHGTIIVVVVVIVIIIIIVTTIVVVVIIVTDIIIIIIIVTIIFTLTSKT